MPMKPAKTTTSAQLIKIGDLNTIKLKKDPAYQGNSLKKAH